VALQATGSQESRKSEAGKTADRRRDYFSGSWLLNIGKILSILGLQAPLAGIKAPGEQHGPDQW
jgi:hypothetical protein